MQPLNERLVLRSCETTRLLRHVDYARGR